MGLSAGQTGLLLSTLSGLATTLGALFVFVFHDYKVLPFAICMSLSAGVMVYVSFVELFASAVEYFARGLDGDTTKAYFFATLWFFAGWMLTTVLDIIVHMLLHRCGDSNGSHNGRKDEANTVTITTQYIRRKDKEVSSGRAPSVVRSEADGFQSPLPQLADKGRNSQISSGPHAIAGRPYGVNGGNDHHSNNNTDDRRPVAVVGINRDLQSLVPNVDCSTTQKNDQATFHGTCAAVIGDERGGEVLSSGSASSLSSEESCVRPHRRLSPERPPRATSVSCLSHGMRHCEAIPAAASSFCHHGNALKKQHFAKRSRLLTVEDAVLSVGRRRRVGVMFASSCISRFSRGGRGLQNTSFSPSMRYQESLMRRINARNRAMMQIRAPKENNNLTPAAGVVAPATGRRASLRDGVRILVDGPSRTTEETSNASHTRGGRNLICCNDDDTPASSHIHPKQPCDRRYPVVGAPGAEVGPAAGVLSSSESAAALGFSRDCCNTAQGQRRCWYARPCKKLMLLRSVTSESDRAAIAFAESRFRKQYATFRKLGIVTALALALHNFPEGIATFCGSLANPSFGIGIAVAFGIHNIPEGFAVAVPIYFGTGSKWKGFTYALLSGIAEPVGAAIAYFSFGNNTDPRMFGVMFALVAGVMSNIALKELYPAAIKYDPADKGVSSSFFAAMLVMAMSLVALKYHENPDSSGSSSSSLVQ